MNILQQPFIQVALPIMVALTLAAWLQNKRFDDLNRRFDESIRRLDRIETKLDNIDERIARPEERTSLVR